jgi:hypothetical protein
MLANELSQRLGAALQLATLMERYPLPKSRNYAAAYRLMIGGQEEDESIKTGNPLDWSILLGWLFTHKLGEIFPDNDPATRSRDLIDEWLLKKIIVQTLQGFGVSEGDAWENIPLIQALITHQRWFEDRTPKRGRAARILHTWLKDGDVQRFLKINRHNEILWFNKESLAALLRWMLIIAAIATTSDPTLEDAAITKEVLAHYAVIKSIQKAALQSGYQVEKLIEAVK